MESTILELRDIVKVYPNGVLANDKASFELQKGEIHALAGENGAGKTTLMKILYGLEQQDSGRVLLQGHSTRIGNPLKAIAKGIGMVHQHFMLIGSLTVAENVMLGAEYVRKGLLDKKRAIERTKELARTYDLPIDPLAKVEDLSVGMKQRVEILKVLAREADIIILDEPTAVLTPQEAKELFKQLRLLKDKGHSIVLITHRLKEIKSIASRVTVMRNGKTVGTRFVRDVTESEISRLMLGKDIKSEKIEHRARIEETILEVEGLSCDLPGQAPLKDVSFTIRQGEIVGIAGVEGNGQRTLVDIVTGYQKNYRGTVRLMDTNIRPLSIKEIRALSVSHIPEDRMKKGINPGGNINENLISTRVNDSGFNHAKGLFLAKKKILSRTESLMAEFAVKAGSPFEGVSILSGGNIQKLVVARELADNPALIVADQPSRGIDVGSMEFIHHRIEKLAAEGSGVLLVSADLKEIFRLADRIVVLYGGIVTGAFDNIKGLDEEILGEYMLGLKREHGGRGEAR